MRKIIIICMLLLFSLSAYAVDCVSDDGAGFTSPIESITIDKAQFTFGYDNVLFESVDYVALQIVSNKYVWLLGEDVKTVGGSITNWNGTSRFQWINVSAKYSSKYVNALRENANRFAKTVASDSIGKSAYEGSAGFVCGVKDIIALVKQEDLKVVINYKDAFKQYNGGSTKLVLTKGNIDNYIFIDNLSQPKFGMFDLKKNRSQSEIIAEKTSSSEEVKRFDGVKISSIAYSGTGSNYTYTFDGLIWRVDGSPAYSKKVNQDALEFNLITSLGRLSGEKGYIQGLKNILNLLSTESYDSKKIEAMLKVTRTNNTGITIANYDATFGSAQNNYRRYMVPDDPTDPDYGYFKLIPQPIDVPSPGDAPVSGVKAVYTGFDVVYSYSNNKKWYITNSARAWAVDLTLNTLGLIPWIGPEDTIPDDTILGKSYGNGLDVLINQNKDKFGFTLREIIVDQIPLTEQEKKDYGDSLLIYPNRYPLNKIKISSIVSINARNADRFVYYDSLRRVIELLPPEQPEVIASPGSIIRIAEIDLECRNGWYSWAFPTKKFRFNSVAPTALEGQGGRWEVNILGQWEDISKVVANEFTMATYPTALKSLANNLDTATYNNGVVAILTHTQDGTCTAWVDQYNSNGILVSNMFRINEGEFNQKYIFDAEAGIIRERIVRPPANTTPVVDISEAVIVESEDAGAGPGKLSPVATLSQVTEFIRGKLSDSDAEEVTMYFVSPIGTKHNFSIYGLDSTAPIIEFSDDILMARQKLNIVQNISKKYVASGDEYDYYFPGVTGQYVIKIHTYNILGGTLEVVSSKLFPQGCDSIIVNRNKIFSSTKTHNCDIGESPEILSKSDAEFSEKDTLDLELVLPFSRVASFLNMAVEEFGALEEPVLQEKIKTEIIGKMYLANNKGIVVSGDNVDALKKHINNIDFVSETKDEENLTVKVKANFADRLFNLPVDLTKKECLYLYMEGFENEKTLFPAKIGIAELGIDVDICPATSNWVEANIINK